MKTWFLPYTVFHSSSASDRSVAGTGEAVNTPETDGNDAFPLPVPNSEMHFEVLIHY